MTIIGSLRKATRAKYLVVAAALLLLAIPGIAPARQQNSEQEAKEKKEKQEKELVFAYRQLDESQMTPEQREERIQNIQAELKARARQQVELAKLVRIPMDQAIQIASTKQTGTVTDCSLIHERSTAFYRVTLVSGDENEPVSNTVFVNAVDGTIGDFPNAGGLVVTTKDGITTRVNVVPRNP